MRLVDEHGRVMDAEYLVEADGGHLALIVESRSGMSGRRPPRNPDYNRALSILLARLNAVLVDALVDSRHTQDLGLPEADRRLIQAPVQLALEPDADALRRRLGQRRPRSRRRLMQPREEIPPNASGCASMFRASCPATPTAWRKRSLLWPL